MILLYLQVKIHTLFQSLLMRLYGRGTLFKWFIYQRQQGFYRCFIIRFFLSHVFLEAGYVESIYEEVKETWW